MSLVLIEFFLQRQRVFHGTDSSHGSAHKHHAPGVRDGDGRIDDVKSRYLAEDLEHRRICSVGGAELLSPVAHCPLWGGNETQASHMPGGLSTTELPSQFRVPNFIIILFY